MREPEIILEESSPHNNLEAFVEQDDRVAYLYLRGLHNEEFGLKKCWLRNLVQAPAQLDVEGMRQGIPPMLPRENCTYPAGQTPLKADRLSFVWFPEGDGIAVLEDGQMLAVIPPWGGFKDFSGYARDCVGESPLCWKLGDPKVMNERISSAQRYWSSWEGGEVWPNCQDAFMAAYERVLGSHTRYFAIDGDHWPPKALIQINSGGLTYLLTLGISLRPQPKVEMYHDDPTDFRRFEFGACFASNISADTISRFGNYISGQSNLPWERFTFFGNGHTIGCDNFAGDPHLKPFNSILLLDAPPGVPELNPPRMFGEKVSLLWTVPITAREREMAERDGSKSITGRFPHDWPIHVIGARAPII